MPVRTASPVPGIPSTSDLAALHPAVAVTLLVVIGVAIIGVYLKPLLTTRHRPRERADPAPVTSAAPAEAAVSRAPAAEPINAAESAAQQFIDHLRAQSADLDRRLAKKDGELDDLRREKDKELDDLRQEIRRLETLLWSRQRGDTG